MHNSLLCKSANRFNQLITCLSSSFSFYMENSRQSIRFGPWCTALFSQWCFSHKVNGCDVLVSKTERPVDTMFFRHQSKQGVLHAFLIGGIENVRLPQTCFFPWICLLKEFLYWQAQLPPIKAMPTRNQF